MDLFCTPARMALDQPDLQGLLRAINLSGNVIPRPMAHALMTGGNGKVSPAGNLPPKIEILEAWAAHEPAESKAGLWQLIRAGEGNAVKAAEALLGLEGLPHPRYAIDDRVGHLGLDFVGDAEKVVWLVDSCYIYPLSCNPLPVYFEENYADHFDSVVGALIEVDAASHAAWLADAGKLFGESGPGKNPEVRAGQMKAMRPSAYEVLEAFAENSDHLRENVELLILIYILEHPDQFPRSHDP